MEHTQLRIGGVPGGRVEHRGEREVRVIQKEERRRKTKNKISPPTLTRIDRPAEPRRP